MENVSWISKILSGILAVVLLQSGGMVSPTKWHCTLTYQVFTRYIRLLQWIDV